MGLDKITPIPLEVEDDFPLDNNLYMTFHFKDGEIARFGYVITAKIFFGFVRHNNEGVLREEDVEFPPMFMNGSTHRALVHYVEGKKFTCYVPVFPTKDQIEKYNMGFNKRSK